MIFLFLRVSHQQANTAPAQHSWLGRWVYVALSKAALLTKIQKEHSQFLSQPRMYFKACSSQNRCLSPRVPHNLVLAKAVPQQGHWTTSFITDASLFRKCCLLPYRLQIICEDQRPHLILNLVSGIDKYRALQINGQENPPRELINLLIENELVIVLNALSEDIATLLFSEFRLDFGFLF